MTFEEFCKLEHNKRVNHYVRFVHTTGTKPDLSDVMEIFGFCERDAKPIFSDAIAKLASN